MSIDDFSETTGLFPTMGCFPKNYLCKPRKLPQEYARDRPFQSSPIVQNPPDEFGYPSATEELYTSSLRRVECHRAIFAIELDVELREWTIPLVDLYDERLEALLREGEHDKRREKGG